jgi:hypothetical protein
MSDDFYFSSLRSGWFENCFEPYGHFGYIGDRERLVAYQKRKSFFRRLVEIVAPRVSLMSLLTKLAGLDLILRKTDSIMAKQIIELVNEIESNRLVGEYLRIAQKRCKDAGLFFDSVGRQYNKQNAVMSADQRAIDGRLIVVEGQLLNRSTVVQFAPNSEQQLEASSEEWLLADFPPHGMVERNDRFKGDLLRLTEDPGFSDAFADYIPFCRAIGWYPYCRITGFYDTSGIATGVFPQLSIVFTEYRRPSLYQAVAPDIVRFLDSETKSPNYLNEWSERLSAAYLLPLVTWNMKIFNATADQREALKKFADFVGDDMPTHLVSWYQSAIRN